MTRFTAIIFIAFISICTSTLCAKSIFDDDAPSAPAPVHVRPPMKLEPEDTPAPKPAPATDTPAETPQT
ncbi:MAG TPA: hypothetical protein VFC46_08045, partial [Humisphaera sp.]|nr:hypothetical protein [Humisphaera sp.]